MEFEKYQHLERFGTDDVDGIEIGNTFIFPKLDGTNGSVWLGDDGEVKAGSRNRELTLFNDNAGFYAYVLSNDNLVKFIKEHPYIRLHGEFLVPHSLKTYRDDAWRQFYVFDVIATGLDGDFYIPYNNYKLLLDEYHIKYIPPIATITNGSYDSFLKSLEYNTFLIKDGEGFGEGIVIKNYEFKNKYNRVVWAKIVRNEFKELHAKTMGHNEVMEQKLIEENIIEDFCTEAFIDKEYSKIINERDGWSSKYIPELLGRVYHELVKEEAWNFVKKFKNPKIDFRLLNRLTISKVKQVKKELFM